MAIVENKDAIIFLDVDGVLNHFGVYDWAEHPRATIYPHCVAHLNTIIEVSSAKLVLSSSWRHIVLGGDMSIKGFEYMLRSHGMRGSLIDTTCHDDEADERGEQIRLWRRKNAPGCRYVVLDDDDDGISSRGLNFVRTKGNIGLTEANAEQALEFLRLIA